ncbi:hypothetical protein B0I35DRAFT_517198 [Stachybotrys elegans]|uniref:Uncharacterized protein n=1 Tax=Stachybotrys elegans TaxID=80388 RepID=A0A8K0SE08_9HYPO|nr:hypothetical protein B0I35DRAFT_517198 [Stachybotrys elegans]
MLAKSVLVLAFAALSLAAPHGGSSDAQLKRVEELRKKGLVCNKQPQGHFYCSDGFGGDCYVDIRGGGSCLI